MGRNEMNEEVLNGLALCAGVGGLELGLSLALGNGYRCVGYCEREAYAASTLVARMEDATLDRAPVWDDIKTFDGKPWRGKVDIISAGYPCQPFSVAGRKLGNRDPRHLWPDIRRIVGEVQPGICFFENVAGHLRLGYADVERDLRELGYEVESGLFSAAEVGAPHKRERLFILAYRGGASGHVGVVWEAGCGKEGPQLGSDVDGACAGVGGGGPACEGLADTEGIASGGLSFGAGTSESGLGIGVEAMADPSIARGGRLSVQPRGQSEADADIDRTSEGASVDDTESRGCNNGNPYNIGPLEGENDSPRNSSERLFPPGPGDTEGWQKLLETNPTLEPALCGVVDGVAYRVDRLRCCGNAVPPLVAAKAFVCLAAVACGGGGAAKCIKSRSMNSCK